MAQNVVSENEGGVAYLSPPYLWQTSYRSMNHELRSRQLNPCDDLFWKSRGYPERPRNWQQLLEDMGYYDDDSEESSESEYSESSESEYSESETDDSEYEEHRDNSNRNNPNNDEFWRMRGWAERPLDWRERISTNNLTPQMSKLSLCTCQKRNSPKNSQYKW